MRDILLQGEVLGAIIGSLLALIGGGIGWWLNRRAQRDTARLTLLMAALEDAIGDIAFLLAVEQQHCDERKAAEGHGRKLAVRETARRSHRWSARFTKGRATSFLAALRSG